MRFTAVATDPMDFTRALRLEFGLEPDFEEHEPVMVASVANVDGDVMLELGHIVEQAGDPGVIMMLNVPHKLHEPARMLVFLPLGPSLSVHMGLTLWAGIDVSSPLLLVAPQGGPAYAITDRGLLELPSVPLGIEATTAPGIERACDRLSERMLAIAQLRDLMPMAA